MSARIFVTSDHHFGHENMYKFLRLDGMTRVRPEFAHAQDGDRAMVERWNATVTPQDHVYHLGDIGIGNPGYIVNLVKALNGHKRIIPGNHDKWTLQEYIAMGFQKLYGSRFIDKAWLSHIPVHPDGLYDGRICIHGHIHEGHVMHDVPLTIAEDGVVTTYRREPDRRYVNVSVEQTNYTPILLEEARQRAKM